jgi:hypothetical protein
MSKLFLTLLLLPFTLYILPCPIYAQGVITSPNYVIQMPNLNSGAGIPSSNNYNVSTTIGQTAPGLYSSSGYRVKAGFQYIYSIIPFSFSISSISINFGHLAVGVGSTVPSTLTVSAGGAGGYQVKASENHPLTVLGTDSVIPDTNCDISCSESAADIWTSSSKYGFGYTMHGNDVPSPFPTAPPVGDQYKQFADRSKGENPQIVMSSIYVGRSRQSTVTYKVNISGIQAAGIYNNTIMYTAIPSY